MNTPLKEKIESEYIKENQSKPFYSKRNTFNDKKAKELKKGLNKNKLIFNSEKRLGIDSVYSEQEKYKKKDKAMKKRLRNMSDKLEYIKNAIKTSLEFKNEES